MLTANSYAEKASECVRLAEEAEATAKRIKKAWRNYHIQSRAAWRKRQHWWERKVKLLTAHEADIMAEWSCASDRRYNIAVKDNIWYTRQAIMYAQMTSVGEGAPVNVPRQTRRVRVDDGVF
jgi:hypothetical protein